MRKVGVQVQDIGIQMCWHTFVDDAGRDLGLGQLVHMAEPPELADLVQPDQPELPGPKSVDVTINIPFVGLDTDDTDNAYTDGSETEVGFLDSTEHIQPDFPQEVSFATPNYTLTGVVLDSQGSDAKVSACNLQSVAGSSKGSFTVHLDYVNWHSQSNINIKLPSPGHQPTTCETRFRLNTTNEWPTTARKKVGALRRLSSKLHAIM
jgi:hypothetical protein